MPARHLCHARHHDGQRAVPDTRQRARRDGFGIVYPDCGYNYFPTAHEFTAGYERKWTVHYDVVLHNFSNTRVGDIAIGGRSVKVYNLREDTLNVINTRELTMTNTGEKREYAIQKCSLMNVIEVDGDYNNHNVILA